MLWENQHFYRHFTPKNHEEVPRICQALGIKVFEIDHDHALNYSTHHERQAVEG